MKITDNPLDVGAQAGVEPHDFNRKGWRFWLCRHCYAPKSLHPRTRWARAREYGDNQFISKNAPHFNEGW